MPPHRVSTSCAIPSAAAGSVTSATWNDALAAQFLAGRREAVPTARGKRDMRTFGGEHPRDRKPDSPACPGDERDTAFQLQFHLPASSIHRTVMSR